MSTTPSTGYWRNVWRWVTGFRRLHEVPLKPGWKPGGLAWRLVYALDYGAACLVLAIGVQPISRWAGERMHQRPWTWLAAALDRIDAGHTAQSGGLLWDTAPCRRMTRYVVVGVWAVALLAASLHRIAQA